MYGNGNIAGLSIQPEFYGILQYGLQQEWWYFSIVSIFFLKLDPQPVAKTNRFYIEIRLYVYQLFTTLITYLWTVLF